ncbi:23S rRNA (adenine(1618)-N(6))-methyltransferase RlmF [Maribacter sp. MAR_2009_72]|uniref:23S rRNA (adenine(1618)-N(6))-methyltransferase RlmF n=1 Tax=Maribacter sp. MAR_2009_72 TaxID=1250050 RepID=UPI00119C7FCB|nr:23S rRNA (adenine(1618)-N(6))-methyltransferase RlmF [Maribacter sp. MAR_2009_72]TVZ16142.1 23S rRNA m(6)A-1618 methyltransferase [Maribacter sp. MAR_2009_72]
MQKSTKKNEEKPPVLHPRNKHKGRYDLKALCGSSPNLKEFIIKNKYGKQSIDFFNSTAVKALNTALVKVHYGIEYWDIPNGFLCPPIPGRADYIHHLADLLASTNKGVIPVGKHIKGLDIGVGANCIYPIIGNAVYGWSFAGTDIDQKKIDSAVLIVTKNPTLQDKVELRLQTHPGQIFKEVVDANEKIDFSICNPPFHANQKEAEAGTLRKLSNLKKKRIKKPELNFGGQGGELWTDGGERKFILNMINESKYFAKQCAWFTTLVSKQSNLRTFYNRLEEIGAVEHRTIPMGQGNKQSRIVAWTFLTAQEQQSWVANRWINKTDN